MVGEFSVWDVSSEDSLTSASGSMGHSVYSQVFILCYSMLFYVVLCCSILFYVLYCSMLFYIVICCSILLYVVLYCYMLFYIVICCSIKTRNKAMGEDVANAMMSCQSTGNVGAFSVKQGG